MKRSIDIFNKTPEEIGKLLSQHWAESVRQVLAEYDIDQPLQDILEEANKNRQKHQKLETVTEEYAEVVLALRGKHKDPARVELIQLAGVCLNLIRRIDKGETIT